MRFLCLDSRFLHLLRGRDRFCLFFFFTRLFYVPLFVEFYFTEYFELAAGLIGLLPGCLLFGRGRGGSLVLRNIAGRFVFLGSGRGIRLVLDNSRAHHQGFFFGLLGVFEAALLYLVGDFLYFCRYFLRLFLDVVLSLECVFNQGNCAGRHPCVGCLFHFESLFPEKIHQGL